MQVKFLVQQAVILNEIVECSTASKTCQILRIQVGEDAVQNLLRYTQQAKGHIDKDQLLEDRFDCYTKDDNAGGV